MTDRISTTGTAASRRFIARWRGFQNVMPFRLESSQDPQTPWFLDDIASGRGGPFILIYKELRLSGAMLRTAYIVLHSWWNQPLEPEIPSNGSQLITNSFGGVTKPVLWMASVGIAGVVGSEVASSSSSVTASVHLLIWIYAAIGFTLCLVAYHWWKLLDRLRRVLNRWVAASRAKTDLDRRSDDIALLGYTFGEEFRGRLVVKSVKLFSIFTFFSVMYVFYSLRH